jgi:hypothetical protein
MKRRDKGYRGDAGQFFVAGELSRRGLVAVITLGNCPNTDILCSDADGTRFVHIQVKAFLPGKRTCNVGKKSELEYGESFFWVLAGIPDPLTDRPFEYYIIPASEMAKNMRAEFQHWVNTPGKTKPHDPENPIRGVFLPPLTNPGGWRIESYLNRWDLIERALGV